MCIFSQFSPRWIPLSLSQPVFFILVHEKWSIFVRLSDYLTLLLATNRSLILCCTVNESKLTNCSHPIIASLQTHKCIYIVCVIHKIALMVFSQEAWPYIGQKCQDMRSGITLFSIFSHSCYKEIIRSFILLPVPRCSECLMQMLYFLCLVSECVCVI